jgi:signal transduction histidine kinase
MSVTDKYISVQFDESQLRERNRALSILLDMSNFLSNCYRLDELLEGALDHILENFEFHAGRIYCTEANGECLHLVAHRGFDPSGLEKVAIGEGISGKAAQTKSFVAQKVSDLEDKERARLLSTKGFKEIVCVPMMVPEGVVGVINLAAKKPIALDQGKIDLLITLANQIAVAMDRMQLCDGLQGLVEELKQKNDTIKFFAYSVSHDLKSPAIGIYGLTNLLRKQLDDSLNSKGRAYCDQILRTSEQMITLLEQINAYIRAKEACPNFEKVMMTEILDTIQTEFAQRLMNQKVNWVEPESLPEVTADRTALIRIFRNIVDNALKYGGEDLSEIRVIYKDKRSCHVFYVSDDGVGISAKGVKNICKPFQRLETSRGVEGTGLGLAIVEELARLHGGTVFVSSKPGEGTTLGITISKGIEANNGL